MNVLEFWIIALFDVFHVAQTPLTMHLTVRVPGFVAVGAYPTTGISFLWAARDANAFGRVAFSFAHTTSTAVHFAAWID